MPVLATMVVEYVAQTTGLAAGVTAAAETMATMGAAAEESLGYLASLGNAAFTTGVGFDGLTGSADAMTASLAGVDASLASVGASADVAVAGIGGVTDATAAADVATAGWVAGLGGVDAELATTGISAEGAMVALSGFAASEGEVAVATGLSWEFLLVLLPSFQPRCQGTLKLVSPHWKRERVKRIKI